MALEKLNMLINGQMAGSKTGQCFDAVNPSTGEVFAKVADASVEDMDRAIESAQRAFDDGLWAGMTVAERGIYLKKIAAAIRTHAKELAALETRDVGKTTKQSTFVDVPAAADTFEYFSNISEDYQNRENHVNTPVKSLTRREPIGVVGCIVPWNYPLLIASWRIAPALITGNTVIVKPSPMASVSIMKLAEIISSIGLPEGVLNIVSTASDDTAARLVQSEKVDMISFTGATSTGRTVMKAAAQTVKKIVTELGGKSPNIVLADCHMDAALGGTMTAIFMNQGQMCTAGSRLLVQDTIYEEFMRRLVEKTKALTIGEADDIQTHFGPVISREHRDRLLKAVRQTVDEGAQILCGGQIPAGFEYKPGFYIEPTILGNVTNDMLIAREEVFGPVLAVMKFSDEAEAIKIANDSKYGLAASVWTTDENKAQKFAKQLQCGTVWVNTYGGFYNEASFGGYKQSGFGRALGKEGLLEFTQSKHVCIDQTPGGIPLSASWF